MDFTIEPITEDDLPDVTAVMTRAFDDDAQRHLGVEKQGPPGYDDGEFFRTWLFGHEESDGGRVVVEGRTVGAFIVWPFEDAILGTIFLDPPVQGRGLGKAVMAWIEERYPARSWTLETPTWATRNHHFYEACGFRRTDERDGNVVFRKGGSATAAAR